MAINDIFNNTSYNIFTDTAFNSWYGIVLEEIDAITIAYAVRKFYFTLTGDGDATTDIEIPITSFQGRRRNANPTYLSAVIKDITYMDQINDRTNGEIYVEMAYELNGVETEREEIIRAELETIVFDEGSRSSSITLSGNKEESWVGKPITLTGTNYKRTTNDSFNFRFSDVNVYLKPGDIVTIGDDEFIPSLVTFSISSTSTGIVVTMEISE